MSFCVINKVHLIQTNLKPFFVVFRQKYEILNILFLTIIVPPTVKVGRDLVGCPIGGEVSLQCFVESSPKAITYWTRKSEDGTDELLLDG